MVVGAGAGTESPGVSPGALPGVFPGIFPGESPGGFPGESGAVTAVGEGTIVSLLVGAIELMGEFELLGESLG